jgi:hypothetical protein
MGLMTGAVIPIIFLSMGAAGRVVGAPGAAERFTMVMVLLVSNVGAALSEGVVIGGL